MNESNESKNLKNPKKTFSLSQLKQASQPKNGRTLVAIDGKVYDVTSSKAWKKGLHFGTHKAGHDLTSEIKAAPHGTEVLKKFDQIGTLEQLKAKSKSKTPYIIEKLLKFHPHPMTIHFPIALTLTSGLFMLLYLITAKPTFDLFALYCITLAATAAPIAITLGFLSWRYNYGKALTPIFQRKIFFSATLLLLQIAAIYIRIFHLPTADASTLPYRLYAMLIFATGLNVMLLGYNGGRITFPSNA